MTSTRPARSRARRITVMDLGQAQQRHTLFRTTTTVIASTNTLSTTSRRISPFCRSSQHVEYQATHVRTSFHQTRLFLKFIAACRQPGVTILGSRHNSMAANSAKEALRSRATSQRYPRRVKCSSLLLRDRPSVVAVAETPFNIAGPPSQATATARIVER